MIKKIGVFEVDFTERRIEGILEYLNDMQEGVYSTNEHNKRTAMAYRDGALRVLSELGIGYETAHEWDDTLENKERMKFTKLVKLYK